MVLQNMFAELIGLVPCQS